MYKIVLTALSAALFLPASAFAGCGNTDQPCLSWAEAPQPSTQSFTQSSMQNGATTIQDVYVPEYYNVPTPPAQIAGLAPSETLCPTSCPVNVYNPDRRPVIDCYNICETAAPKVVFTPPQPRYRLVRVVRPIIYVQSPTVYHAAPDCNKGCASSRYGY